MSENKRFLVSTRKGSLIRAVGVVLSGSAGSQIVTLLVMLPLARIYTPSDFGFYAIVQAVVTVGAAIATLKYDFAIVLPKTDTSAMVLFRLASFSNVAISSLVSILLFISAIFTTKYYADETFAYWLTTAGIITFVTAQIANLQFWLTRIKAFKLIAINRIATAVLVGGFQVVLAFVVGGYIGLLLGLLFGQLVALIILTLRTPELRKPLPESAPKLRDMAKRYRKMPLLTGPNALLDSLRDAVINGFIGKLSIAGLGQYSIAYKVTMAPVSLVSGAISQVLLQRLSVVKRGHLFSFIAKSAVIISVVTIPVFVLYYLIVPWLVPFAFGSNWTEAGLIAQALVPWAAMRTITSPLSSLYIVIEAQEWALAFATVYTIAPIVFLVLVKSSFLDTMTWLGILMATLLFCWIILALLISYRYDKQEITVS